MASVYCSKPALAVPETTSSFSNLRSVQPKYTYLLLSSSTTTTTSVVPPPLKVHVPPGASGGGPKLSEGGYGERGQFRDT